MHRTLLALSTLLLATPAMAQQYWLPNGPGGTTWNNPQGSFMGTVNEHMLQRHAQQLQWQRQREASAAGVPQAAAPSQAAGADPSFRLNNGGGRTVREVYVSSSQDSGWGADRLGQDVMGPGARLVVRLPMGQCVNDIRVVFADGTSQERRGVNTCGLTDLSVR
ncbi:hypothetical protein ACE7GA_09920 [Roseomonas sp. CCTCC AB2023176]|uniref:hypothetical protein n=1 Tax=Roseomonas sp. CCTCC AB2023176 TaxID=3342640 RepID=UPI0035D74105